MKHKDQQPPVNPFRRYVRPSLLEELPIDEVRLLYTGVAYSAELSQLFNAHLDKGSLGPK